MSAPTPSLNQFEHWLHRRLRVRRNDEPVGGPSLSLSHLTGTRSSRYGALLVDYLNEVDDTDPCGWFLFDETILQEITAENLTPSGVGARVASSRHSPPHDRPPPPPTPEAGPLEAVGRTIRDLARLGRCVFLGSCSAWLVRPVPRAFTAFVTGSLDRRVASIAERHGFTPEQARAFVRERDDACRTIVRRAFGARLDDPSHYHLVLNTDDIPDPVAVCLIADSMLEWAARPADGSTTRVGGATTRSAPHPAGSAEHSTRSIK